MIKCDNNVYSGVYSIKLNLNNPESRLSNVIKKKIGPYLEISKTTNDMYDIWKWEVNAFG